METMKISDIRGCLEADINLLKEHAIITHFNVDTTELTSILNDSLKQLEDRGVTKVYLAIPHTHRDLIERIRTQGFVHESDYPKSFVNGQEICSGYDYVHFLSDGRRATEDEKENVLRVVMPLITSPNKSKNCNIKIKGLEEKGYKIRLAKPEDSKGIQKVYCSTFLYTDDLDGLPSSIENSFEGDIWVVCENPKGKIVGIASTDLTDHNSSFFGYKLRTAEIADCAVLPEERNKGIMTAILRNIAQRIRRAGLMPQAYCTEQSEAIHKAVANAGFYPTGISEKTNHLVLRENPDFRGFNNNIVYFKY